MMHDKLIASLREQTNNQHKENVRLTLLVSELTKSLVLYDMIYDAYEGED